MQLTLSDGLSILVAVVVALSTFWQIRATRELQIDVNRINTQLDQSLQQLHRAREVVIQMHKALAYRYQYSVTQTDISATLAEKIAEAEACFSELRGIALALQDEELRDLIDETGKHEYHADPHTLEHLRRQSQNIHMRIWQLIEERTNSINSLGRPKPTT